MSKWHGCLSSAVALLAGLPTQGAPPEVGAGVTAVKSHILDIDFSIHPGAQPVQHADLWVSTDDGQNWGLHGNESGARGSIRFRPERDGVYGLFLVLRNSVGSSSGPPPAGQSPQLRVLVDSSSPLVQITRVQVLQREEGQAPLLIVSWTAYDAHLGERPVTLYYRASGQTEWHLIANRTADVGRFDWQIPREAFGRLTIKIEVADRAGNRAMDTSEPLLLAKRDPPGTTAAQELPAIPPNRRQPPPSGGQAEPQEDAPLNMPSRDPKRAQELHDLALWHKERGEYGLAAARLVEALNYSPEMLAPAHDLAEIYYTEHNYQGALNIYNSMLEQHSADRQALRGSALVMVALSRYPEALQQLERVLAQLPEDAETWLHAGDVFLWMGQRAQAKRYWQEARRLSPEGSEVASTAKKRIEKYGAQ